MGKICAQRVRPFFNLENLVSLLGKDQFPLPTHLGNVKTLFISHKGADILVELARCHMTLTFKWYKDIHLITQNREKCSNKKEELWAKI